MKSKKILVTGGEGRFAKVLREKNKKLNLFFASKKDCNILDIKSITKTVRKIKPKIILHCAGLSRPMKIHEKNITKSIKIKCTINVKLAPNPNNIHYLFVIINIYSFLFLVIKRAPLLNVRYDQIQLIKTIRRLRKPIKK